jgi:hypothetical protein
MPDVISHLRQSGFSDDEVTAWAADKRNNLLKSGFSDDEVDDYFGVPKTPKGVPSAFLKRIVDTPKTDDDGMFLSHDANGRLVAAPLAPGSHANSPAEARGIVTRTTEGTAGGFGEEDVGISKANLDQYNWAKYLQPFAKMGDFILRVPGAAIGGASGFMAGVAEKAGEEPTQADKLQRDLNVLGTVTAIESGMRSATRVAPGPTGAPEAMRVGGLPKGDDFSAAGRAIGNGDTTPAMEGKLADLYEKQGVHPAEVAHDAQSDPTITQSILSSDKEDVPKAYGDILGEQKPIDAGAAAAPQATYSDAEKHILSKISIDEKDPQAKLTWDKMYTRFLDKLYPIGKAVKEADLADLPPEDNPYNLARLLSGHVGKADHFLNNGTFDFTTYENNGPSLKSILAPVKSDLNGFRAYATAARALELEDRGIMSGFAEGEVGAPPLISTGLDAARTVVVEGRDKYEAPFRAMIDYQNKVSQYLRDSGALSDAGYKAMTEANKMYVPFTRVMGLDEGASARGGSSLQAHNPIKAIKGSARDIVDPIESVVRNTYHMVEMAERNQVGTKLVDMLRKASEELPEAPAGIEAAKVADSPRAGAMAEALGEVGVKKADELAGALAHATEPVKPGEIAILRDGKRETYKVDPELANAMKGLDQQSMGALEKILAYPASILRAGAVTTPDFALRHTIRDFLYAATTFKSGTFTPIDMGKGFAGLIMKDEDFWNWMKGGGGNISMVGMDRQYLQADLRKLTGQTGLAGRAWNVLADPEASMWDKTSAVGKLPFQAISKFVLDPLRAATQFAESASHLGAFKKTMRAAERAEPEATDLRSQIIRSAWESRDTAVDAARMGANMRAYNMITAFANIKLQDTDRVVRAIKDNPIGSLTKIGATITAPSVILWAANHDDPRYSEIPQWQKDMFWLVMTPNHVFRVPKPWAMGMIFGSGPERMLDAYVANKPEAFKEYFKSLWAASGPDFVPTAASPIIDQFANRSTFTNRTLIPSEQEKFLPEYQYTPYTTELSKSLGKIVGAFPGMTQLKMDNSGWGGTARALTSPILIENYIRGWTGTLGVYAMNAADKALRMAGQLPDPPMPTNTLADIPVIKAFVVAQMGGPMMFAQLDGIKDVLSEHNHIIRDIYKNPDMPPAEKRQLIDQFYFSMIQIGKHGNEMVRQMKQQSEVDLASKRAIGADVDIPVNSGPPLNLGAHSDWRNNAGR